jgi:hypothetical protein
MADNHNRGRAQLTTKTGQLTTMKKQSAEQIKVKKWLAIRKEASRNIDPETAEVLWAYGQVLDPYGVDPELRRNVVKLEGTTSLAPSEATHGFGLAIHRYEGCVVGET